MPRKTELFGHFMRTRLIFSGFNLKLPLTEQTIVRSFSRNPEDAESWAARMKVDAETQGAISSGVLAYRLKMQENLQDILGGLEKRHASIMETYLQRKLQHAPAPQLELYLDTLTRFEKEIKEVKAIISGESTENSKLRKERATAAAVRTLQKELAAARQRNKTVIFAD